MSVIIFLNEPWFSTEPVKSLSSSERNIFSCIFAFFFVSKNTNEKTTNKTATLTAATSSQNDANHNQTILIKELRQPAFFISFTQTTISSPRPNKLSFLLSTPACTSWKRSKNCSKSISGEFLIFQLIFQVLLLTTPFYSFIASGSLWDLNFLRKMQKSNLGANFKRV